MNCALERMQTPPVEEKGASWVADTISRAQEMEGQTARGREVVSPLRQSQDEGVEVRGGLARESHSTQASGSTVKPVEVLDSHVEVEIFQGVTEQHSNDGAWLWSDEPCDLI